ncbi:sigma 54-interacting transcriptional regulator [Desulforhopalus singaporensis]|uniref:Arginine utilization regulatory protein n=1 Tax=Desulforhopalus singaporensis TaxID=91360 RepID=A0A1H0SV42_9BACT|nr:sigma 54-interacting transcriptional regulator [Desulforhopalus singaporensis]SDP45138.1 arginine utilization regulatory protein [Desulforhopalus singaporensis]
MFVKDPESITAIDISDGQLYPVLSSLDIGILMTNAKGEITFYNPMHAQLDGLAPGDVLGKKITDVYHLDEESSLVMRCLRTGRPIVECPILYKARDGQIVDSITSVYPLVRNGETAGVIAFVKEYRRVEDTVDDDDRKVSQISFVGDTDFCLEDIVGKNPSMLDVLNRTRMAAQTDSPVLIYGETGTGKELIAQSIHNLSGRKNGRFIAINCAAIPETLLEGILFGTKRGAFTGAIDKAGLFERANGGTLFLDEVNSMTKEVQPKLLRAIQEKKVSRIGSHRELKLDLKIISSINNTIEDTIETGEVRRDLLYRLSVVYISIPPLRVRMDDIPLLVGHFLEKYNRRMGRNVVGLSSEVKRLFEHHNWPGNVRELENIIEGALNMVGQGRMIEKWHLMSGFGVFAGDHGRTRSEPVQRAMTPRKNIARENWTVLPATFPGREDAYGDEAETQKIMDALSDADGNISDASVIMGVSRQTFYRRLKALNIKLPQKTGSRQRQLIISNLQRHGGNVTRAAKAMGISRQLLAYRMKKMKIDRSFGDDG